MPAQTINSVRDTATKNQEKAVTNATWRQGSTDELVYQKNIFFNKKQGGRPRMQVVKDQEEEQTQSSQRQSNTSHNNR